MADGLTDRSLEEPSARHPVPLAGAGVSSESWPPASAAWRLTALLTIAYMVSFLDRFAIGLLIEPIKASLHLNDLQIGLLLGPAFAIFYLTLGLPIGLLADRYNRRNIVIAGFITWSAMTTLCGLASSFSLLFLARVGVGVGEAALAPCALSMIGDSFPPERRARAIGLYMSGSSLGSASTFLLGGSLVGLVRNWVATGAPPVPFADWQIVFMLIGLPGVLIATLFFGVAEPRRRRAGEPRATPSLGASLPHLRSHWRPCLMLLTGAGGMAAIGSTVQWDVALFQRNWGWSVAQTGVALGTAFLVTGVPGALLSGWAIGRMHRAGDGSGPIRMMLLGLVFMVIGMGLGPLAPSAPIGVTLTGVGLFGQAIEVAAWPVALVAITPSALRSQVVALYWSGVLVVSLLIAPAGVGALTDALGDLTYLRYSLTIVTAIFGAPALAALLVGLPHYRRTVAAFSE